MKYRLRLIFLLFKGLYADILEWYSYWKMNPDDYYCCDGLPQRECGCGGITNREALELRYEIH